MGLRKYQKVNSESRIQIDKLKESLRITSARCLDAEKNNKEWKDKVDEDKIKMEKLERDLMVATNSFDDFVHYSDTTNSEYKKYLKSLEKKKNGKSEEILKIMIRE